MKSQDDGESWSEPRSLKGLCRDGMNHLTPGPANSGIQLRNGEYSGRLVVALAAAGGIGVMYSDDHGGTWTLGGMTVGSQGYEPQIAELSDGRILLNVRNHSDKPGRIISVSADGGITFTECFDERLSAQLCQASLLRCTGAAGTGDDGATPIVFCGPGDGRRLLTVRRSNDDCETWPIARTVYSGPSAYSAMAVLPDGQIGVLYERDAYRRLSFARFPLAWLRT
jgi:sialidase-1